MEVYKTNAAGWSAAEELRKSLVELEFKIRNALHPERCSYGELMAVWRGC